MHSNIHAHTHTRAYRSWHTQSSYRSVFCSRVRQSAATWLSDLDLRKAVTSLRRLVLGAKMPVASHMSSQPRSSLRRCRLSVSCLITWQKISSRRMSCHTPAAAPIRYTPQNFKLSIS